MKIYYIPNFYRHGERNSQTILHERYIGWLQEAGYDVVVLYPEWGDRLNQFIHAKNYENLPITLSNSNKFIYPAYVARLARDPELNKALIITHQDWSAHSVYTAMYEPRFKYPKMLFHFIGNQKDYNPKDPNFIQSSLAFKFMPNIINSGFTAKEIKNLMMKIGVSPIGMDTSVVNLGIDFENIPKKTSYEPAKTFKFIYPGNSLMSFKQADKLFAIYDTLYSLGVDFEVSFYLMANYKDKVPDKPYYKVYDTLDQKGFWDEAVKHDAFITVSKAESYGMAYWELCELGLPGLFWDYEWVTGVTPGFSQDLLASNKNEMVAKAKLMVSDYQSYVDVSKNNWSEVRKVHDLAMCKSSYLDVINKTILNYKIG